MDYNIPGEMQRHFKALEERVAELEIKSKQATTKEEKAQILDEVVQVVSALGNMALFKMKRGDAV